MKSNFNYTIHPILHRLQQNDTSLTSLLILDSGKPTKKSTVYYRPRSKHDWDLLGQAIATNNNLIRLDIKLAAQHTYHYHNSSHSPQILNVFYTKLNKNRSIRRLSFNNVDLQDGKLFSTHLSQFFEFNIKLTSLSATHQSLGGLASVLATKTFKTTSLKYLNLSYTGINDDCCRALCEDFTMSSLRSLELNGNRIKTFFPFFILLCNPKCVLNRLCLEHNEITNRGVVFLSKGLVNNKHLKTLLLDGNAAMTSEFMIFLVRRIMQATKYCSVSDIMNSNHTLQTLTLPSGCRRHNSPGYSVPCFIKCKLSMQYSLRLNRSSSKNISYIINQKVVLHHFIFKTNIQLYEELPGHLLPRLLSSIANYEVYNHKRSDKFASKDELFAKEDYNRRHSALYRFIRLCPSICERWVRGSSNVLPSNTNKTAVKFQDTKVLVESEARSSSSSSDSSSDTSKEDDKTSDRKQNESSSPTSLDDNILSYIRCMQYLSNVHQLQSISKKQIYNFFTKDYDTTTTKKDVKQSLKRLVKWKCITKDAKEKYSYIQQQQISLEITPDQKVDAQSVSTSQSQQKKKRKRSASMAVGDKKRQPLIMMNHPTKGKKDGEEVVLFNTDALSKIISYLPSVDVLNLATTCKRFGISDDEKLSVIKKSTHIAVQDIATKEQLAALPHYDGESSLADYHYLQLLRVPLTFDQLVSGYSLGVVHCEDKSCVRYKNGSAWGTAFSNNILRAGKHYASFHFVSKGRVGVMRPGQANEKRRILMDPMHSQFFKSFSRRLGHGECNNDNSIHCCFYDIAYGHCYSSDWHNYNNPGISWDGMERLSSGDELGMLLDLDEGTLSVYKNGRRLGVMMSGLVGPYCWVFTTRGFNTVRIKRGKIPP